MMMSSGHQKITIFPNDCVYTACYCEENVWKLCDYIRKSHPQDLHNFYAVFISNKDKKIPIWHQRASKRKDRLVIWDYHVIALHSCNGENWVYDLDTELPFPCRFEKYMTESIRNDNILHEVYKRCFRVIPASDFLTTFASDRSHMLKEDGTWMAVPPSYPCISTAENKNNLHEFICMRKNAGVGTVYTTAELLHRFS